MQGDITKKNEVFLTPERSTYRQKTEFAMNNPQEPNVDSNMYLKLERIFNTIDLDRNGMVAKDELFRYFQNKGIKYNNEAINTIFGELDFDHNDSINLYA